jgi:endonuclease G, mitochondrial
MLISAPMNVRLRSFLALTVAAFLGVSTGAIARRPAHAGFEPISLYASAQRSSTFDGCRYLFPAGKPISLESVSPRWKPRGLCSNGFAVLHSGLSKTPLIVVERINRGSVLHARHEARTNVFFADPRLPASERADLRDYARSGLDRGHLSPAADQPDEGAMAQSFALSNMVPQDATNNRKIWAKLESDTRKFAQRAKGDVYVFSGPLFKEGYRTMGRGHVWVPTHLFKLVYDQASGRAWAHILPNTADALVGRPMSYAEFVETTGWHLLPAPVTGSVMAR